MKIETTIYVEPVAKARARTIVTKGGIHISIPSPHQAWCGIMRTWLGSHTPQLGIDLIFL
ncbi:unnamed protein product [marine sediment metagenome]|uniref:Uncharacterized protein n=1 Tax=marine sediment metagenome TaxID=412755 RepID=X1LTP8_9ZZZZ